MQDTMTQPGRVRRAMNLVLRDSYMEDCVKAMDKWNKILEKHGLSDRLYLASERFNRHIGMYAGRPFGPHGELMSEEAFTAGLTDWLPTPEDYAYVKSLMVPVYAPGEFANWIAPPAKGLNGQPVEFEYVKFHKHGATA